MSLKQKKPVTPSQRGQVSLNTQMLQKKVILEKEEMYQKVKEKRGEEKEGRGLPSIESFEKIKKSLHEILEKKAKKLIKGKRKKGGRNNKGVMTVRGRGGGHKQNQKEVSFKRNNIPFNLMVYSIHQDGNRSANIAFLGPVFTADSCEQESRKKRKNKLENESPRSKNFFQILCPKTMKVGDIVKNEENIKQRSLKTKATQKFFKKEIEGAYSENPQAGDSMALYKLPLGSQVHNLEINPGQGGKLIRSAGNSGQIIEKELEKGYARIKLPSGSERWVPLTCRATQGIVGNEDHRHIVLGKAGASRWRGRRPKVRGVAMNPVDHPHGGGEGRTSGGRPSVTPWGRPTRSFRLHKRKKNPFIIKVTGRATKKKKQFEEEEGNPLGEEKESQGNPLGFPQGNPRPRQGVTRSKAIGSRQQEEDFEKKQERKNEEKKEMGTPKKNRRVEGDDKKRKRKMRKAFVHSSLIKKIDNIQKEEKKKKSIEVYSRSSTILPTFVSKTFKIQNGKKFVSLKVTEKIVGQKFGEFARTRFRGKDPRPKAANRR